MKRNIVYCSMCCTYYKKENNILIKLDRSELDYEEKFECLNPDRRLGGIKYPIPCDNCLKKINDSKR